MQHILVVDDDRISRETVAEILREEGYVVATAANGEEAVEALDVFHPHLVITDLQMPKMGGMDVLAATRARGDRPPVIIATAFAEEVARREAMRLGAAAYLNKPIDLDVLLRNVAAHLPVRT